MHVHFVAAHNEEAPAFKIRGDAEKADVIALHSVTDANDVVGVRYNDSPHDPLCRTPNSWHQENECLGASIPEDEQSGSSDGDYQPRADKISALESRLSSVESNLSGLTNRVSALESQNRGNQGGNQ